MAVEDWIDRIAKRFEISDGRGGTVRSFRAYEKAEFPESIPAVPCALTYTTEVRPHYSLGASYDLWKGTTEFHLTGDVSKKHFPYIMLFFARIIAAAAGDITLDGHVAYFLIDTDGPGVQGPVVLQYGTEAPHLGLVVRWAVKESSTVTVA